MINSRSLFALVSLVTFGSFFAHADDVLRSEFGAPLKVIIRHDTAVFGEPNVKSPSQAIRQFEFYFVLPADDAGAKTQHGFYRIATGKTKSHAIGWVAQDDVQEWPHAEVLGVTQRIERDPVVFFKTSQDALNYVNSRDASAAISREPEGVEVKSLLPLLAKQTFTKGDEPAVVYETTYLNSRDPNNTSTPATSDQEVTLQRIRDELSLDIAFVLDTTGSMQPYIDEAREVISSIAESVNVDQSLKGRVRLALVGYRDRGDDYVSKVFCTLDEGTDLDAFVSTLSRTVADGGGDDPEQVFAGVKTAVKELDWNPLASRHIALIGDAPNHSGEASLVDIEDVLTAAQPAAPGANIRLMMENVTFHALRVGKGVESAEAFDECGRQFGKLSAGLQYSGVFSDTDGVKTFSKAFVSLLQKRLADLNLIIKNKDASVAEKLDEHAGPIGPVMQYLGRDEFVGATFASGHVCEIDCDGNRTVEPYLLVGRSSLRSFNSAVDFIVTTLEGTREAEEIDVDKVIASLKTLTVNISYAGEIGPDTPLDEIMNLILGLPVKSDIFKITPARLASFTQADYENWVKGIKFCKAMVQSQIDRANWFNLGRETRESQQFAFVRIADLP